MSNEPTIQDEGMSSIEVSSGFGHNTQQPYVQLLIHQADYSTQMTPETARELALNLLTAADAAESDGFIVGFLRNTIGVDDMRAIATILVEFREYRDKRRDEKK